jgi:hypothetical protein
MRKSFPIPRRLPAWAVACGLLVLGLRGHGQEQPARLAGDAPKPKDGPTRLYYGVSACAGCHTERAQVRGDPPVLCRCDEAKRWAAEDKHKDAYLGLKGDRAKRMGELLGYKRPVYEEAECLSCHAVAVDDKKLLDESFKISDGVSCVACHGAYEEWVDLHGSPLAKKRRDWREMTREDKESKFGMADLWDPGKRAKLCASCHVGSAKDHKFVTHAMYAAGHPPLPGFEAATFSDEMPRHWQYVKEKTRDVQALLKFDPEDAEFEKTKLVVAGGLLCLRQSLNLLADQAREAGADPKPGTLDLANFDCYACHHDLKYPAWRQQRGSRGKPGRPQPREWPLTLARVAVRQAGDDPSQLQSRLDALYQAFGDRPFGDPEKVVKAADDLVAWLDGVAKKLASVKYTRARAREVLAELSRLSDTDLPDYDSARERVWAFRLVYGELEPKPADEVVTLLAALDKQLKLKLPSRDVQILKELPDSLEILNAYDPVKFRKTFQALARAASAK